MEHNKDIYYVQRLFGHSKASTTMEYIGLDEDILIDSAEISDKYVF